jgi:hypothetical protein
MSRSIVMGAFVVVAAVVGALYLAATRPSATPQPLLANGYEIKGGEVYWVSISPQRTEVPVPGADAETFVPLENGWGKDAYSAYYNGYTMRPADASVPSIHLSVFASIPNTFYAKDDQAVYFPSFSYDANGGGTYVYDVFPDADPGTFVIVEPLEYAKDKSHVWDIQPGEGGPARAEIRGADPAACTADNLEGCEAR